MSLADYPNQCAAFSINLPTKLMVDLADKAVAD